MIPFFFLLCCFVRRASHKASGNATALSKMLQTVERCQHADTHLTTLTQKVSM